MPLRLAAAADRLPDQHEVARVVARVTTDHLARPGTEEPLGDEELAVPGQQGDPRP
jgi:hypothetical protein